MLVAFLLLPRYLINCFLIIHPAIVSVFIPKDNILNLSLTNFIGPKSMLKDEYFLSTESSNNFCTRFFQTVPRIAYGYGCHVLVMYSSHGLHVLVTYLSRC